MIARARKSRTLELGGYGSLRTLRATKVRLGWARGVKGLSRRCQQTVGSLPVPGRLQKQALPRGFAVRERGRVCVARGEEPSGRVHIIKEPNLGSWRRGLVPPHFSMLDSTTVVRIAIQFLSAATSGALRI